MKWGGHGDLHPDRRRHKTKLYSLSYGHSGCGVQFAREREDPVGFAPTTYRVRAGCSTGLNYESVKMVAQAGIAPAIFGL